MKTEADFSIHTSSKSGYKSRCKECIKSGVSPVNIKVEPEGIKICKVCKVEKPFEDFYNMSSKTDGKNPKCKKCVRDKIYLEIPQAKEGCKICSRCKIEKEFSEYHNNKIITTCKECLRNGYYLKQGKTPVEKTDKPCAQDGFKFCNQCKEIKEINKFGVSKRSKDKLSYTCKQCNCRNAYDRNPPKNIPPMTPEERKEKRNSIRRERYINDPLFKLESNLRGRINDAYKCSRWVKDGSTVKLLGVSYENAMKSIESQFIKEMSWNNQGSCKDKDCDKAWHLDHIIPFSWAKNEEEMRLICHYSNLQPLWEFDNISKNRKIYPCTNLELGITFWEDHYEYINKQL